MMSKKKTAASEAIPSDVKPAVKERKPNVEKKMYVGPTVVGFAVQNTVYQGLPDNTAAIVKEQPELSNLFIEITDYAKASRMIRERQGYIYSAYAKALDLKNNKRR